MSSGKIGRRELQLFLWPLLLLSWPLLGLLQNKQIIPPWLKPGYSREVARRSSCQNNMKQIAMALRLYSGDFNGKYPPLVVGGINATGWDSQNYSGPEPYKIGVKQSLRFYKGQPVGWADAIFPYLRSDSLYMCPAESVASVNRSLSAYTDYWLNGNLSGVPQKSVTMPAQTLLVGDGNDGTDNSNATYNKTSFGSWLDDQSSPMYRHLGGANYLFVDGHVQWLKPQDVKNFGGRSDPFALK